MAAEGLRPAHVSLERRRHIRYRTVLTPSAAADEAWDNPEEMESLVSKSGRFRFDGGAATFVGTGILAALVTICTLGICYPFALVLRERWKAKHSYIDGFQLVFTGSAIGLFGNWLKWLLLSFITLGIYLFWVGPRIARWKWEHTDFDQSRQPLPLTDLLAVAALPVAGIPAPRIQTTPGYVPNAIPGQA